MLWLNVIVVSWWSKIIGKVINAYLRHQNVSYFSDLQNMHCPSNLPVWKSCGKTKSAQVSLSFLSDSGLGGGVATASRDPNNWILDIWLPHLADSANWIYRWCGACCCNLVPSGFHTETATRSTSTLMTWNIPFYLVRNMIVVRSSHYCLLQLLWSLSLLSCGSHPMGHQFASNQLV